MYSKETMARFMNPRFVGEIENPDSVGEAGNMKCGDIMRIYIKVKDELIDKISFKTYGCVTAIGASDYLCEIAKGMHLDKAENISSKDIIAKMGDVPHSKIHCSILAHEALKKAIQIYKEKNG
jgi:nitrogen fixation protein NifU and related proteins